MKKRSFIFVAVVVTLLLTGCKKTPQPTPTPTPPTPVVVTVIVTATPAPTPTPEAEVSTTPEPEPLQAHEHGSGHPQMHIPHPNLYMETTVSSKEYTWTLVVNDGEIGIIGGWSVNGQDQGTYKALSAGAYTVTIIDGFALTVEKQWARDEWDFRIAQAIEYGWAHANLDPGPIQ